MVQNAMRFVLYAGGRGGGRKGFLKKFTGRLRPGVQPLPLAFYIPIPLLTQKRYPLGIPTRRTLHPFQLL